MDFTEYVGIRMYEDKVAIILKYYYGNMAHLPRKK